MSGATCFVALASAGCGALFVAGTLLSRWLERRRRERYRRCARDVLKTLEDEGWGKP